MKMKSLWTQVAAAAALAFAATAANAELLNYSLTGSYTASWQLDSATIPSDYVDDGFTIFYDVAGFPDAVDGVADLYFYSAAIGGGLSIDDFYGGTTLVVTDGPQLYSGSESTPLLSKGIFALTEYQGSGVYTLTVTAVTAVPEPATVALMLAGLGVVGATAVRRRKREMAEEATAA